MEMEWNGKNKNKAKRRASEKARGAAEGGEKETNNKRVKYENIKKANEIEPGGSPSQGLVLLLSGEHVPVLRNF